MYSRQHVLQYLYLIYEFLQQDYKQDLIMSLQQIGLVKTKSDIIVRPVETGLGKINAGRSCDQCLC